MMAASRGLPLSLRVPLCQIRVSSAHTSQDDKMVAVRGHQRKILFLLLASGHVCITKLLSGMDNTGEARPPVGHHPHLAPELPINRTGPGLSGSGSCLTVPAWLVETKVALHGHPESLPRRCPQPIPVTLREAMGCTATPNAPVFPFLCVEMGPGSAACQVQTLRGPNKPPGAPLSCWGAELPVPCPPAFQPLVANCICGL